MAQVSHKQVGFFTELTNDKEFPAGTDINSLRTQFAALDTKSASQWIEKALSLPNKPEGDAPPVIPPTF